MSTTMMTSSSQGGGGAATRMVSEDHQKSVGDAIAEFVTSQFREFPDAKIAEVDIGDSQVQLEAILDKLADSKKDIEAEIKRIKDENQDPVHQYTDTLSKIEQGLDKVELLKSNIKQESECIKDKEMGLDRLIEEHSRLVGAQQQSDDIKRALNDMWVIRMAFLEIDSCKGLNQFAYGLERLDTTMTKIRKFPRWTSIKVLVQLMEQIKKYRQDIVNDVNLLWCQLVDYNPNEAKLKISKQTSKDNTVDLADVIEGLAQTGELGAKLDELVKFTRQGLEIPCNKKGSYVRISKVAPDTLEFISIDHESSLKEARDVTESFEVLHEFLKQQLESAAPNEELEQLISNKVLGAPLLDVVLERLDSVIPPDLERQQVLIETDKCGQKIQQIVQDKDKVNEWRENIPNMWLDKRRQLILDNARMFLQRVNLKNLQIINTQQVVPSTAVTTEPKPEPEPEPEPELEPEASYEEADAWNDGWGSDEDETSKQPEQEQEQEQVEDDDDEDWGKWDDNDDNTTNTVPQQRQQKNEGEQRFSDGYKISACPDFFKSVCDQILEDRQHLGKGPKGEVYGDLKEVAGEMEELVSQVLALYRALGDGCYYGFETGPDARFQGGKHGVHELLLFNDMSHLAELLLQSQINKSQVELIRFQASIELNGMLEYHWTKLEAIVGRMRGFSDSYCLEHPDRCNGAIQDIVEYLDMKVNGSVLEGFVPQQVRLQVLGTLLSRVVETLTREIIGLGDIGETESKMLSRYILQISRLDKLFYLNNSDTEEPALTAAYCPGWLKFCYLGEILDSHLDGVEYLLNQGSLIDFTAPELISLIRALFVDSDASRRLIHEVRDTLQSTR